MKELNKTKLIMIIIIALVVIAAIILGVIFLNRDGKEEERSAGSISSAESEFEELKVKDIELKYVEESNATIINFLIENTTEQKVENLKVDIQLFDEEDKQKVSLETDITTIDAKKSHPINLHLQGNIQGIKKIKLVKVQTESPTE